MTGSESDLVGVSVNKSSAGLILLSQQARCIFPDSHSSVCPY